YQITLFGVWPDLVTLYALFFILYGNHKEGGYIPVMLLGLLRDVFSIGVPGTYAILYGLLHKLLAGRKGIAYRDSAIALVVLGAFAVFAVNFGYYMLLVVNKLGSGLGYGVWRSALMSMVSAPLMPVLVLGMSALLELLRVEKTKEGCFNI
ncbi:MAG: hypothetical protein KDB07_03955, partial [Planctomycetes bacterium]|nr:hypothetical protein [Planctomycetota bacterium]